MSIAFTQQNMLPKCADCGEPIPMDQMLDHVCKPSRPPPSPRYGRGEAPELRPSRSQPQREYDDAPRQRLQSGPARYRPSSPTRSELGRVRTTPSRNPPPPAIQIPHPRSAPMSPGDRQRAASMRSSRSNTAPGLPSGPRKSLEDNRQPMPARRRPSNESMPSMRHRPSNSKDETSQRLPFNANSSSNGPKSADALMYRSQSRGPPPGSEVSFRSAPEPMPQPRMGLPPSNGGPVNMAGVGRRGFAAAANAVMAAQEVDRLRSNNNSRSPYAYDDMRPPLPSAPADTGRRPSTERRSPLDDRAPGRFPPDDRRTPPSMERARRPSDERRLPYDDPRERQTNDRRVPPSLNDRRTPPAELRRMNNSNDNNYLSTGPSSSGGPSPGSGYSMGASTPPLSPALSSPSSPSLHSPISPSAPDIPLAPSRTPSNGSAQSKLRELREMRDGPLLSPKKSPPLPPPPPAVEKPSSATFEEPRSLLEKYRNYATTGVSFGVEKLAAFGSSLVTRKESSSTTSSNDGARKSEDSTKPSTKDDKYLEEEEEETMLAYGRDSVATDSVIDTEEDERIQFPSVGSTPPLQPRKSRPSALVSRSGSTSSAYSTSSSQQRAPTKSAGAADRTLETLLETSEPNTPLPTATPPSLARARSKSVPRRTHGRNDSDGKVKFCVKCDKRIDDGRWVRNEGGGVLCEGCWKNLYLPRCRRCDLPIERGAVSSSDGQLKGKYHKGCFTCHTCQEPFPSKSFYVFENNPYCSYHYHLANNSLCAAATCGEPIEGPCAVAHNGDRYHPEHFTCEWRGRGGCMRSLDEYWEVDGERYCDYHARRVEAEEIDQRSRSRSRDRDRRRGPPPSSSSGMSRAQKRVTRYISLAGLAGGEAVSAGGAGGGGLDALGLNALGKKLSSSEEIANNTSRPGRSAQGRERGRFL